MESVFDLLSSSPVTLIIAILVSFGMVFLIGGRILRLWQKVPPNEILIVYGQGGTKVITGGGGFVWPIFQDTKLMERGVMNVSAQGDQMPTKNNVEVEVDWTAQIQIGESDALIKTAAAAFLDKDQEEIVELIRGSVAGSVRAVIATLTPEEARGDREQFAARVNDIVRDDMERMGLRVTSLNIVEVKDPANTSGHGYYAQLQAKEIARVDQEARVAQANANQVARQREAEAGLAAANTEIAAKQSEAELQRDLDLKKAAYANETNAAQALADMAGELKRAELERQLKESQGASLLAAESAATLVAEQATARRRNQLQADVVAVAEAEAERTIALAKADEAAATSRAEAVRQAGQAEADSILAKATAEAGGQQALAEAMNAFGKAGLQQQLALALIQVLPALAEAHAKPLTNIGELRILDTGNGNGLQGLMGAVPMGIMNTLETARLAGINLPELLAGLTAVTPAQPEVAERNQGKPEVPLFHAKKSLFPRNIPAIINFPMAPKDINQDQFDQEVVQHKGVVFVDFHAEWCGPCKMTEPIIEDLATNSDYKDKVKFVKVDVDANQDLAAQFSVFSIPTFITFKDGEPVGQFAGARDRGGFEAELNKVV